MPDGIKSIGDNAFEACGNLQRITIPEDVTSIGDGAFAHCSDLVTIIFNENLNSIGNGAFELCSSLTRLRIPESVTKIGGRVFFSCTNLESVELPSNITKLNKGLFQLCESLRDINIPTNVSSIEDYAFAGCYELKNLDIPDSVETIGMGTFKDCIGLEEVSIPENLTRLESVTFAGCYNLRAIELPDDLLGIGWESFNDCTSLQNINIPKTVESIDFQAFENCESLKELVLHNVEISIGSDAFNGCKNLNIYSYEGSNIEKYAMDNRIKFVSIGFTVHFDVSYRYGNPVSIGVEKNSLISPPESPKAAGYIFKGWYKDSDGIATWDFKRDRVTSPLTLYARMDRVDVWELDKNSVDFNNKQVNIPLNKTWTIEFNQDIDASSVDEITILVLDSRYNTFIDLDINVVENIVMVNPNKGQYEYQREYVLYIMEGIKSVSGKSLNKSVRMEFRTID